MSLADQYRQMHAAGAFRGYQTQHHVTDIAKLIDMTGAQTLLDYGCGKGLQYMEGLVHRNWGSIMPTLYDPYYPPYSERPKGRFDGVICTDVAEHVPEDEIEAFLKDLAGYADRFIFMTICTRPAKKHLPDGRNCHLTVRPEEWWRDQLLRVFVNYPITYRAVFT